MSTRSVPLFCPLGVSPDHFSYHRLEGACPRWSPADAGSFFETAAPDQPVVLVVHGNRAGWGDAAGDGLAVLRQLQNRAGDRPFRLVAWSWPADRVSAIPRRDALEKASRCDVQSYYLAAWLDRLPPGTPVSLIGYSFGARLITGALHLAEGGSLAGWALSTTEGEARTRPVRAMLIAAALDSHWLLPNQRHGLAAGQVERVMITRNLQDPVLRYYPRMNPSDRASALGFAGPAGSRQLIEAGLDFETVPLECQVGRDHSWATYLHSPAVRSRLAWYAFLADGPPAN